MRKWTEVVKPYQDLVGGAFYKVKVKNIRKTASPRAVEIELEFLDASQQGRRTVIQLPLPIRHGSLSASFFSACGLTVTPSARIAPRDAITAIIAVSFGRTPDGDGWQPIDFKSISKG
jgi:hypothetical protein